MSNGFKDYFRKINKQSDMHVPPEIIKILTEDAPKGFEYKDIGNDTCLLTPSLDTNSIHAKINSNEIKVLSPKEATGIKTIQNLFVFANNMQKEVVLHIKNADFCIGNGTQYSTNIIRKTIGRDPEFKEMRIFPQKFQKKEIVISGFGDKIKLNAIQKISTVWTEEIIETEEDVPLILKWKYDIKSHNMNMKVLLKFKGSFMINDIIKYMKAYRAFFTKEAVINGIGVFGEYCSGIIEQEQVKNIENEIEWWEKVEKIEKALQVKLEYSMPLKLESIELLNRLYVGIVMGKMLKEKVSLPEFKMETSTEVKKSKIKEIDMITTLQEESLKMLGSTKTIYKRVALFNLRVEDVENITGKCNYLVKIKKESINNVLEITKYYLTEDDIKEFTAEEVATINNVPFITDILKNDAKKQH